MSKAVSGKNIPSRVTAPMLQKMKERGEKIVMLTCYDYPSARLLDEAGVDVILIGDSVGDNVLGYRNTIPVTMEDMLHHTRAVCLGVHRAFTIADMPFLSYQVSPEEALRNAGRLMKETGVQSVKIEGGAAYAPTVRRLVTAGIPVCGHIGLTPQSVHVFGGFRVQGRDEESAKRLVNDACALSEAGVFAIVLELVPDELAGRITKTVPVPTIGIGAGPFCDGQVQVFHDLVGLNPSRTLKHVKRYAEAGSVIREAVATYAAEVRDGLFPSIEKASDA
jgi:3-methyl-2-oxobutanoate hydroxymethyltransferase